jgi:hypothetical protein
MRFSIKILIYIAILVVAILLAWWTGMRQSFFQANKSESASVMLEKIKKVTKLIAVEGSFTELYDYKETYEYDYFKLFSKKALLRVNARVSIGYDFEKVNISIDSLSRTVILNEFPIPEILSIDHNLDYYDISQGTFNKFTNEEYNEINKNAKQFIVNKAKKTDLFKTAEEQKEEYLLMMEMALKSIGWKLHIKANADLKQ